MYHRPVPNLLEEFQIPWDPAIPNFSVSWWLRPFLRHSICRTRFINLFRLKNEDTLSFKQEFNQALLYGRLRGSNMNLIEYNIAVLYWQATRARKKLEQSCLLWISSLYHGQCKPFLLFSVERHTKLFGKPSIFSLERKGAFDIGSRYFFGVCFICMFRWISELVGELLFPDFHHSDYNAWELKLIFSELLSYVELWTYSHSCITVFLNTQRCDQNGEVQKPFLTNTA